MLAGIILFLFLTLVGITYSSRGIRESHLHLVLGLVITILSVASFSSISLLDLRTTFIIFLTITFIVFLLRVLKSDFRLEIYQYLKNFFSIQVLILIFFELLLHLSHLDFATRNFDAYYANQDANFLVSHNSRQMYQENTEPLPLIWSASVKDRYGVSYLSALLKILGTGSIWQNSQFVYLTLLLCFAITFYGCIGKLYDFSEWTKLFLSFIWILLPTSILQINYFMYGQVAAIPSLFLWAYLLSDRTRSFKSEIFLTSCFTLFGYFTYPPLFFVYLVINSLYFIIQFVRNGTRGPFILINRFFIPLIFQSISLYIFSGFSINIFVSRIIYWVNGNSVSNAVESSDLFHFQASVFAQYASKLFLPLTFGAIPYPVFKSFNLIFVSVLSLLVVLLFVAHIKSFYWASRNSPIHINFEIIFFVNFMLILYGFVVNDAYLIVKVSTWIISTFIVFTFMVYKSYIFSFFKRGFPALKFRQVAFILSMILLASSFGFTSISYISKMKNWNSFSNVPSTKMYNAFGKFKFIGEDGIGIVAPTAEEAVWTASLLDQSAQRRTFSVAANALALPSGYSRSCQLNSFQKASSGMKYIVAKSYSNDILQEFVFSRPVLSLGGLWNVGEVPSLQTARIVLGGGTFPPNIVSFGGDFNVIRWSSGHLCIGIYESKPSLRTISVPFRYGPDQFGNKAWSVRFDSEISAAPLVESNKLSFKLKIQKGWHTIDIVLPSCYQASSQDRWNRRADDRRLCLMFGEIKIK